MPKYLWVVGLWGYSPRIRSLSGPLLILLAHHLIGEGLPNKDAWGLQLLWFSSLDQMLGASSKDQLR